MKNHEQPDYDYLVELFENEQIAYDLAKNHDDLTEYGDSDECLESGGINDNDESMDDGDSIETSDVNNNETSLAIIHEIKWTIPEKYIHGVVIDVGDRCRFIVGEHLGDGHTGFVRSGKYFILQKRLLFDLITFKMK